MTENKAAYRLFKDNILFLSVPLCAILGLLRFDTLYKTVGLCLFVCAFCVIYKLYEKTAGCKNSKGGLIGVALSALGFFITVSLGIFAELPNIRWLFLTGILLSVMFSDILSALMSAFIYVLIITMFTNVTPEFVANSFLTAVILIILTRYYSDLLSVMYSIVILMSFEVAFFLIMHGLRTDKLITASHVTDAVIISACILVGWILSKLTSRKNTISEPDENPISEIEKVKDYSYLFSEDIKTYNMLVSNEKLYNAAKRTSKFVKEITKLVGGNCSLAEVGAFYAECGRLISSNYIKEGLILAKQDNFPKEVTNFIKEHNFKLGRPSSRETAITMLVCKLTSTIEYLESKGIKHSIVNITDGVMDSCLMAGRLTASGLSLNDYKVIKDYLMEEAKLNYDYFNR